MNESVFFRLSSDELELLNVYCESTKRTKSDVLRELVRSLKIKKKPPFDGRLKDIQGKLTLG